MNHDKQLGFVVENIGFHPAEKVSDFAWSPAGDIFCLCEKEGLSVNSRSIWYFYLIVKTEVAAETSAPIEKIFRGKGGKQLAMQNKNTMTTNKIVYEFRKTARHEATDQLTVAAF